MKMIIYLEKNILNTKIMNDFTRKLDFLDIVYLFNVFLANYDMSIGTFIFTWHTILF